jgi:two-component system sensor histidine kinase/response regulator
MSPPETSDAVNLSELMEIMDNDMELIQDCFNEFTTDWPAQYVEIKQAVLEKNAGKIDASAHKLKGTLRYLAAQNAADAAFALESAGKDNDMDSIDQKLETLKTRCQQVVEYIRQFNP